MKLSYDCNSSKSGYDQIYAPKEPIGLGQGLGFDPLFVAENIKSLRNRNVIIYSQDVQLKFLINTFSYFSHNFLICLKLDIFNLNYNQFFKEVTANINNIFTSLINHFAKFNLTLKCFYLVKDKNLQPL